MKHFKLTKLFAAILLTIFSLTILTACGASATAVPAASQTTAKPIATLASTEKPVKIQAPVSLVGKTKTEEIYVALLVDGKNLQAYTCDGTPEQAKVSEWFKGELGGDNAFTLKSEAGATIEGKLTNQTVSGLLKTVSGKNLNFEVVTATGTAGMYRLEKGQGNDALIYGWVVLNDGSIRGSIKSKKEEAIFPAPRPF
jgi:hypothetical protein